MQRTFKVTYDQGILTMPNLSPHDIQNLVTKAFVLEAITDKPGCTTRFHDLAGKPLQDFIIAGINSSESFRLFAEQYYQNSSAPIFSWNLHALQYSNQHKSSKYINFGLLEILFPTVAARLKTEEPSEVIEKIIWLIKETSNDDVQYILETRQFAWSTSVNDLKTEFDHKKYSPSASVWEFYGRMRQDFPSDHSNHQWADEFYNGLPILRQFFDAYMSCDRILDTTTQTFKQVRTENPEIRIGIIADMCAAAIFLWLSFSSKPVT